MKLRQRAKRKGKRRQFPETRVPPPPPTMVVAGTETEEFADADETVGVEDDDTEKVECGLVG